MAGDVTGGGQAVRGVSMQSSRTSHILHHA
jgi:hypothetical protein